MIDVFNRKNEVNFGLEKGNWYVITIPNDSFFQDYFDSSLNYFKGKKNVLNLIDYNYSNSELIKPFFERRYDLLEKNIHKVDCIIIDVFPINQELKNKFYKLLESNMHRLCILNFILPSNSDITIRNFMKVFDFANRLSYDGKKLLGNVTNE